MPRALRASQGKLVVRRLRETAAQTTQIAGQDTEGSRTSAVACADAYRFGCRTLLSGDKPRAPRAPHSDA